MAKAPSLPLPSFGQLPEFRLPKIDLDALFEVQNANIDTLREVQDLLIGSAQAIAKVQYGWVEETLAGLRAVLSAKAPQQPEAVLGEVKAVAEKAVAVTRQSLDLGVGAQRRVAELLSQRAAANVDELKSLAAA